MLSLSKLSSSAALTLAASALISCNSAAPVPNKAAITTDQAALPSITQIMPCLREDGPIMALHRGRDKTKDLAENSLEALKSVYDSGYIMAELDVAGLKDGTLILFHDGVWEEKTTGKGIVGASTYEQVEKFLLTTPRGVTAQRVPLLSDILNFAKGRIYLELDFKSSANEAAVIDAVKAAGMEGQVILIGYTLEQSRRLYNLLPSAMISAPVESKADLKALGIPPRQVLAWAGTRDYDPAKITPLNNLGVHPAFGMMSPRRHIASDYSALALLVTDYPDEALALSKIKGGDKARLKSCAEKLGL